MSPDRRLAHVTNYQEHYALERFFHSTVSILDLYTQHLLHNTANKNKLQSLIEDERSEVFDSATNYYEADWTKFLHYALACDLVWMNVQLTMNEGTSFKHPNSGLADKWSSGYGSSDFHFFHGVSDLTLKGKIVGIYARSNVNDPNESLEAEVHTSPSDKVVEIAHQRNSMVLARLSKFAPEKLGELLAVMIKNFLQDIEEHYFQGIY